MIVVNTRHPQNMCCTLDFCLAKDLVTVTYGVIPFSARPDLCQDAQVQAGSHADGSCAPWCESFHHFLSSNVCLTVGFRAIFYHCSRSCVTVPKNPLKKQVQI